ncbi:MAG: chorismate--pyruvate lyase [Lachnospiraceae bacterium]|nr:chorismate--pyruvate lyase [Lachnospiraceae bacterium]
MFEAIEYIVAGIDGDYAHLKRVDLPEEPLKLVARALLPDSIVEGSRLCYEMMQYSLIS